MATTTHKVKWHAVDSDEVDRLATEADGVAAQPAMDVASVPDACEIVARQVAEFRADVSRGILGASGRPVGRAARPRGRSVDVPMPARLPPYTGPPDTGAVQQ